MLADDNDTDTDEVILKYIQQQQASSVDGAPKKINKLPQSQPPPSLPTPVSNPFSNFNSPLLGYFWIHTIQTIGLEYGLYHKCSTIPQN